MHLLIWMYFLIIYIIFLIIFNSNFYVYINEWKHRHHFIAINFVCVGMKDECVYVDIVLNLQWINTPERKSKRWIDDNIIFLVMYILCIKTQLQLK